MQVWSRNLIRYQTSKFPHELIGANNLRTIAFMWSYEATNLSGKLEPYHFTKTISLSIETVERTEVIILYVLYFQTFVVTAALLHFWIYLNSILTSLKIAQERRNHHKQNTSFIWMQNGVNLATHSELQSIAIRYCLRPNFMMKCILLILLQILILSGIFFTTSTRATIFWSSSLFLGIFTAANKMVINFMWLNKRQRICFSNMKCSQLHILTVASRSQVQRSWYACKSYRTILSKIILAAANNKQNWVCNE